MATRYREIAHVFSFEKSGDCPGKVIATQTAIYLIPGTNDLNRPDNSVFSGAELATGNVGVALARLDHKRIVTRFRDDFESEMTDLQPLVADDQEWPLRSDLRAVVLPREEVTRMKYPWWGALVIDAGERRAVIKPVFFNRSRAMKALREMGWPI